MVANLFQKPQETFQALQKQKLLLIAWVCLFLGGFQFNSVKAEIITYPAQLEGCSFGGTNYWASRSSCSASTYSVMQNSWKPDTLTSVSCIPDKVSNAQYIPCTSFGLRNDGSSWSYLDHYVVSPTYVCVFGGKGAWPPGSYNYYGIAYHGIPFNCEVESGSVNVIPTKNLGTHSTCDSIGNPIHPSTGNKSTAETDYHSPPLIITRHYNSQQNRLDRNIGIQWRHTYSTRLVLNPTATPPIVFAERSDGKTIHFKFNGVQWIGDSDISERLLEIPGSGWQLIDNNNTLETYNTSGRLLSITNRDGRTQTLGYDVNGRLNTVTDDTGRALTFTYDASSRIQTLTDPAGGIYRYAYDSNGGLASVTYPDGKIRTYHYNEPAFTGGANLPYALTGITDENGVRFATYTYDTQGRAITTEHAGGVERNALGYSSDGSQTLVTDPLGSQYTHHFQTILGVAKSTGQSQPAGSGCNAASSQINYDVNGNAISRADFNGNKTCYAYDSTRNLEIARVGGVSSTSSCPSDLVHYTPASASSERKIITDWHASFRLPVRITEAGRETNVVYDTHGNITQHQIRNILANTTRTWNTSYSYHPTLAGVILQKIEDGPRTDVTDITTTHYYPPDATCSGGHLGCRGQIASITNALSHVTQITRYNAHGQPEEIIDPNGLTTVLTYDTRQRLLSRTVGTEITRYQYDGVGQLKKITFPDSSFLSYSYDDAHRLTGITDNMGNRIQYTLDTMGNRTKEEVFDAGNNLAKTQQREYDALSRLWQTLGAENQSTQYQYDAQGNLKQVIDPLLHTTHFQFDARNRWVGATDPANGLTQQTLNALDRVTQISDPKTITTSYSYNGFGDVTQETSADRGITKYTYDSAGNLKTVLDARGVKHTYTWDALNRPTKRTHTTVTGVPATTALTWSYDAGANGIGRLTNMTDESGSTSFSYDPQGRLLNKTQMTKNGTINYTHTLGYQYDSLGRIILTTYPSGTQIATSYGANGRPSEIRINGVVLLNNIAYHPLGEPKNWKWGNGRIYTRNFDLDGQIKMHPIGNDTRTLTYDLAGRITHTTDTNPVYNRGYDYDSLDRLVGESDNSSFKSWQYDANSNRTQAQFGGTAYPYTIAGSSNRLTSVAGPTLKNYSYDAAGNPLSDGATTFTWNAAGKLTATVNNGKTHTYRYNALDQRVFKNSTLSPRFLFFYDPNGQLIGEYRDNTATVTPTDDWLVRQETIWLEDIPVAVIKKATATSPILIYFIHTDHLNTPRVIVNQSNTPVWRWENTHAFGANLLDENPDGNSELFEYHPRFPGQYFDKETGLHYNYFRYYEPETGRYISPDPIGLAGGINTYVYVAGNPMSFTDPTGEAIPAIIAACAGSPACAAVISAGVGAIFGAAIDIASQLFSNGGNLQCVDTGSTAISAGIGAIPVGVVGAIGSKILGQFLTKGVTNPVPGILARVVPGNVNPKNLSAGVDAFVTDAKALQGLNAKQIADKLTIPQSSSGFRVIEFPTPSSGIASPILRNK